MTPQTSSDPRGHAVVVGGSMAGLLAARALSERFDRVTLVERDRFPDGPVFRKGVPQSRHLHALLGRGMEILEQFFPGLHDELTAAGAADVLWPRDVLWLTPAGWLRRFSSGLAAVCCSRELLEFHVRRRLAAIDRVSFREACDVTGLLADGSGTAVAGVRLHARPSEDGPAGDTEELAAAFVVDASGRDSRAPHWLQELGYPAPRQVRINAFLGYASRCYAVPKDFPADWKMLFLQGNPARDTRGGALFPIEGNRWLVTVAGVGKDYPPTEEEGFLEFTRSIGGGLIHETIKDAEPLSPIVGYRRTENQLRRYDRLSRWPERFVVMGDAACAFNPVYGQGMTVAAIEALTLRDALAAQGGELAGVARRVQRAVAKSSAPAWLMATSQDLRYPTTEGGKADLQTRIMHHYFDRLLAVATENEQVNLAFGSVINLLIPPTALFRPGTLLPVLRGPRLKPLTQPPTTLASAGGRTVSAAGAAAG